MTTSQWPNFTVKELSCRHCGGYHMNAEFMNKIQDIRTQLGFPMHVTSAYRCPEHDREIHGAGVHPTGHAIDILTSGTQAYQLLEAAIFNRITGIGVKQTGPYEGRFLHLDDLIDNHHPRPRIWSYT